VLDGAALDDPSREPKPVTGILDVPVALLERAAFTAEASGLAGCPPSPPQRTTLRRLGRGAVACAYRAKRHLSRHRSGFARISDGRLPVSRAGRVYGRSVVRSSEHKSVANRELCRQFLDAYRPDRLDDLLALLHPDIEWTITETWVEREVWHGHAEVRVGLRRFFAEWEDFSNDEVEAFTDGGDKFAVATRMRGRSRGTRIATEMRTSGVFDVRDGLIVRIVGHSDPADALAAVANSAAASSPAETERSSQNS
jgi:ketosteroid isomerase-like protein